MPPLADGHAGRPRSVAAAELLQEAECEVLPHVPIDLPAGDTAVEPRRTRRVHALLDLLDDVQCGRPAEARHQGCRQRIVVRDGAGGRRVGERCRSTAFDSVSVNVSDAFVVFVVDD